ncbi:MAG TPA: DNA repair protein RecN [Acidimicrobiia bacterium]|jgi:DNA repair protein RecN (Recombination protein N)
MSLVELRVTNLGIISELQLVLGDGFTTITGETGAGKTLLVEAVALLLGARADATLVRAGADEARVEARFVDGDSDEGAGVDASNEFVLARVVAAGGRSRAYIDGNLATVGELAARGRTLVDLHGQWEQQSLLAPAEQRHLLDAFAGTAAEKPRAALRSALGDVSAIDARLASLGGDTRSRAREIDLLRFQITDIDETGITADEEAELDAKITLLGDADELRRVLADAHAALEGAASDATGQAVAALETFPTPLADVVARGRGVQAELSELVHDLRLRHDSIQADPEQLAEAVARRQRLRELRRKYGETLADVLAYADESRARLEELVGHDELVGELEQQRADARAGADKAARKLRAARTAAAPGLAAAVTEHLHELALGAATFDIVLDDAPLSEDGIDAVTFVLAPNPGEPPRPLAKAASGGELSRTMLAIRVVLSQAPPTLVFDEVDAGLGGEAGVAVGRALATLGQSHQVLCVTHLAQVAATADAQLHVSKHEVQGRTEAQVELLLDDARVHEVARMLGGAGSSASAQAHARELLSGDGPPRDGTKRRRPRGTVARATRDGS